MQLSVSDVLPKWWPQGRRRERFADRDGADIGLIGAVLYLM